MGFGILDDRVMSQVPGTTRYFDDPERPQAAQNGSTGLRCDTSGPVPIILVPQPSGDDPNDPLNWPLWKRDIILLILSLISIFATSLGPILAANTLTLSLYFGLPFTKIALLTGYYLLGVGLSGILCVPSARIWGKRHLYLLGNILLIVSSCWGGASTSYSSLLWARIFQGIASAPFEALINVTVGDLFFVHERGKRMALANLAVFGGSFFTPILVGKITHTIGWAWSFYFVAIFCSVCFPLVFFLVPETTFLRTDYELSDDASSSNGGEQATLPSPEKDNTGIELAGFQGPNNEPISIPVKSKRELLLPFSGRKSTQSFHKLLLRPFPLLSNPAIIWACLTQGTMIGWTVFIGIILAAIFLGPPLFWSEVETGYAYTGAFIGAVAGFLLGGALADWSARVLTRRNEGIYEPEFRLVLILPGLALGCTGLYGFGITASEIDNFPWILPVVFFSMQVAGMVISSIASALYIVDAYRYIAIEAFTCLLVFKNFLSFGLTFSAYGWLVDTGVKKTFLVISSIQVVIFLLSIPMYIFGKKNRSFFYRHDILKIVGLA